MKKDIQNTETVSLRRRNGKRLLADSSTCKIELKKEVPLLFKTYYEALEKAEFKLSDFPPYSRSRNLEASIIQSCFAEKLLENFRDSAFFGKYRRLILSINGYLILFKKLDKKGFPMNIKTVHVQNLLNQSTTLDLFSDVNYSDNPILYFGYQKDKFGDYMNPQLIYIDEEKIKFSITEADFQVQMPINQMVGNSAEIEVKPRLKGSQVIKKAN